MMTLSIQPLGRFQPRRGPEHELETRDELVAHADVVAAEESVALMPDGRARAWVSRFDLLASSVSVDAAPVPGDDTVSPEMYAFAEAFSRPATTSITEQAFDQGLWQRGDVDVSLGAHIREVVRAPSHPRVYGN